MMDAKSSAKGGDRLEKIVADSCCHSAGTGHDAFVC
jgi:hypothetical protein